MHILLDFDGTITQDDTIDALGKVAVAFQQRRDEDDWATRWTAIVDAYLADHAAHVAGYAPASADRTTLAQEFAFLRSLRDRVDVPSIHRVRDARLFAGLTADRLAAAGTAAVAPDGAVRLRAGFAPLLALLKRRGWPVSVVSINWSDAWIRGVLHQDRDTMGVFANTVTAAGDVVPNFVRPSPGGGEPVASCSDKREAMEAAVGEHTDHDQTVYIGDSPTDLECLVGASAGIVMASHGPDSSSTLKTLARLQYHVPHVSEACTCWGLSSNGPRLAWAADFAEILASRVLDAESLCSLSPTTSLN